MQGLHARSLQNHQDGGKCQKFIFAFVGRESLQTQPLAPFVKYL